MISYLVFNKEDGGAYPCEDWDEVSFVLHNVILVKQEYYEHVLVFKVNEEIPYTISFNEPK